MERQDNFDPAKKAALLRKELDVQIEVNRGFQTEMIKMINLDIDLKRRKKNMSMSMVIMIDKLTKDVRHPVYENII